jgi:hypothetical protein
MVTSIGGFVGGLAGSFVNNCYSNTTIILKNPGEHTSLTSNAYGGFIGIATSVGGTINTLINNSYSSGLINSTNDTIRNYLCPFGGKVALQTFDNVYYEMRKSTSSFEDLNYDINSPTVTANTLGAKDLVGKIFSDDRENKWFASLTEKETFEKGVAVAYDKIITELNRNIKYKIQFANELVASKGQIIIGNSPLSAALEQALYKMKDDIIKHRMGNAVKAPIVVQPLSFNMEVGSFVKYQGATYIVTQFNEDGTVQIYNPLLEGASAKISVSKASVEILSNKAKIVNYKDTNYIVTPKGTIISLTTNKAMQWPENDGNRVAILKLAKANQELPKVEVKKLALSFTETPSSPNQTKLVNGTKTTTIRKENQAGLAKGQSGTQIVKNTGLVITLRGEMTIEEAGGKTAMLKSEGVATEADFMYDQSRNWVNGTGTMFVYDIERFEDKYKGNMPIKDFLSLPLDKQRVIIEQQLNC